MVCRFLCLGRGSNPYGHYCPKDFKSFLSTNSNTKAKTERKYKNNLQISALGF